MNERHPITQAHHPCPTGLNEFCDALDNVLFVHLAHTINVRLPGNRLEVLVKTAEHGSKLRRLGDMMWVSVKGQPLNLPLANERGMGL